MIKKAHERIELFKLAFGESVKSFTEHLERLEKQENELIFYTTKYAF